MRLPARAALALPILGIAQAVVAPARAMDYALTRIDAPPAHGVERNLGLSVLNVDRSPGAHRRETLLLPLIEYYGASGRFAGTLAGVGWNLSHDKAWQFGPRLTPARRWVRAGRSRPPSAAAGPILSTPARISAIPGTRRTRPAPAGSTPTRTCCCKGNPFPAGHFSSTWAGPPPV